MVKGSNLIACGPLVQQMPFKATHVRPTRCRRIPVEQSIGLTRIAFGNGDRRRLHVSRISADQRLGPRRVGGGAILIRLLPQETLLFLCRRGPPCQPCAGSKPQEEGGQHRRSSDNHAAMPPRPFPKCVGRTRRAGAHRFMVQIPLHVRPQARGGVIAPGAILLQCLEYDPIQIALDLRYELEPLGLVLGGDAFHGLVIQQPQPR